MDFMQSQTMMNLARSFAGESQARARYTTYAAKARKEQQEQIARAFDKAATNEQAHARAYWKVLRNLAKQDLPNIKFEAGYPFLVGNTAQNLQYAADGEFSEHANIYPAFAQVAKEEGFPEAQAMWTLIAQIEGQHHLMFQSLRDQFTSGTLFEKDKPVTWKCLNCGHIHSGLKAWETCPVCKKPQGWAKVMGN